MTEINGYPADDEPYGQIILFGDSITEKSFDPDLDFSYGAALTDRFRRRFDVINRGFSGYTTQHGIRVLPKFMPTPEQTKVKLMIIFFGANDSCLSIDPTGHHVPLDIFRHNLSTIITHPKVQAHEPHILLVTPPPIDERQRDIADRAKGWKIVRRNAENTKAYAEAVKAVGAELNVPVVDIFTAFLESCGWENGQTLVGSHGSPANGGFQSLFSDGLHLNGAGYKILFEQVFEAIVQSFPELDPDAVKYVYPPWETAPK